MIELNRKVRFSHTDFTYAGSPTYTEYLLGSVGLRVTADIRIDVHWETEDTNMKFLASDDSIQRLDGGLSSFLVDGFKEGDTIAISGTASNNMTTTITSISDDGEFLFVAGALTNETVVCDVYGETPVTSMEFYPNLIENGAALNLFNLTDRETIPKYYADAITTDSAAPTPMVVGTNSKGWVSPGDAATIYRSSFTNHVQTFVISHTFTILPLFLANQLADLQRLYSGKPPIPSPNKDRSCLKYVYTIDAKYSAYDPDPAHTTDGNIPEFPKGQTGGFNEFLNGRQTIWTKKSILYSDNATGAGLSEIDYCKNTLVDCQLTCQVAPGSVYIVHVMYLPTDESIYLNTATDWAKNFIYERAIVTIGGGTVQGQNTGDYHFLKNVGNTQSIIGNDVRITFEVDFGSVLTELFDTKDSDNLNYLIFITPQGCVGTAVDACTDILSTNQTALIMDVNVMDCNKDDATLFQIIDEWQFFEYPHCNGAGFSNFSLLPRDTVVAKGQFHVKKGTADEPITLKNIGVTIAAVRQNDVQEVVLESFNINTTGFLPNGDNIQEIYFEQNRDFIIPTGDCRNTIQLTRMPTLDIAGYAAYELIYPFKVRWEEWRALTGADRFFPGPTQNWMVYTNLSGWTPKFAINAEVEYQVEPSPVEGAKGNPNMQYDVLFEHIVWGEIKDPCEIPYSVEFNTFDLTGVNSYEEVIARDTDTLVEATITGDFSGFSESDLYGILGLDVYGIGGVAYIKEIGTRINVDADGVWDGVGSTLKATLTKVSNNTVKLSAFIDSDQLPTDVAQFLLSARIGKYVASASSSGAECLNEITVESFTCGQFEIMSVTDSNTIVVRGEVVTQELRQVSVQDLILTFVTSTTWTVSGGTINGRQIITGSVGGNIIKAPTHPYTNSNVGDTIQGAEITGTLYSSLTEIDGIGDMQIGCTFIVS